MPEHVHLLIREPQRGTLADALKSLKQGVSRRLIGGVFCRAPTAPARGLFGRVEAIFRSLPDAGLKAGSSTVQPR